MAPATKHVSAFSEKYLRPNETVRTSAFGYLGDKVGNGALIITSERG